MLLRTCTGCWALSFSLTLATCFTFYRLTLLLHKFGSQVRSASFAFPAIFVTESNLLGLPYMNTLDVCVYFTKRKSDPVGQARVVFCDYGSIIEHARY